MNSKTIKTNPTTSILTICALICLFIGQGLSAQPIPSYVPTNGLVGWWPFNGNANDESGNGNHGTVNGATLTTDRVGNTNYAYNFNGLNQNIEVANSNTLNPIEISISVWIYPLSDDICIISKNETSNATAKSFRLSHQDFWQNQHGLSTRYGSVGCNSQNEAGFYGSQGSISNNTWSHIVITVSSTGMINHYINGTFLESNQSVPMVPCNNPISTMRIGGLYWNGEPNWFNGKIDDIGIWNRVLTQQEITDLFNAVNCSNSLSVSPSINQLHSGGNAIFVASTSDPNPSYVWQTDFGQDYQTLNSFGNYSGVNTNTLTISNVQLANHLQSVRAISTSGNCIDTSNISIINITDSCIVTVTDTNHIAILDTTFITVNDTNHVTVIDTNFVTVIDTNYVTITDTTFLAVTDTLLINTTVTSLLPPNNTNTIKVFPNPAKDHITIDYGNFALMSGFQLRLENSLGQQVYLTNINQQTDYLSLSTWGGSGLYFLYIIDPSGNKVDTRKIVLQ